MAKFYFTYGTDEKYPYKGGWTEVEAPNYSSACKAFCAYHPKRDYLMPCADVYAESAFVKMSMFKTGNFGARCHERITLNRDLEEGERYEAD